MLNIECLKLRYLAQSHLTELVRKYDCGWFDGGCYTFSYSINCLFPEETELFHVSRTNNNIDHVVIKIKDKDLYGDADGWHTKSELFSKMKNQERVDVEYLLPVDQQQIKIPLFHDISESIQNSFKRNHFLQFEIPDTSIKVSWNVFDPGSASITSELGSNECGGPWSGAVDAIESIVLSHFCSGVDILDSPYIDGLISSLFAIGDNMDDCDCNDCVNET